MDNPKEFPGKPPVGKRTPSKGFLTNLWPDKGLDNHETDLKRSRAQRTMLKISLACVIQGKGEVFRVEIDDGLTVNQLKETIMKVSPVAIERNATDLELFLLKRDDGAWLDDASAVAMAQHLQTPLTFDEHGLLQGMHDCSIWLKHSKYFGHHFQQGKDEIHVLVVVPSSPVPGQKVVQQRVLWYGGASVDLNDDRILRRSSVANDLVARLDRSRVLLVNGPPMRGKTTLAALVGRELVDRSKLRNEKAVVANLSLLGMSDNDTFLDALQDNCNIEWSTVKNLSRDGYTVYFVVDETQNLYKNLNSEFWTLVKRVHRNNNIRNLPLDYGFY